MGTVYLLSGLPDRKIAGRRSGHGPEATGDRSEPHLSRHLRYHAAMGDAERAHQRQHKGSPVSWSSPSVRARRPGSTEAEREARRRRITEVEALLAESLAALRRADWPNSHLLKTGPLGLCRAAWPVSFGSSYNTVTGESGYTSNLWLLSDGHFLQAQSKKARSFGWCLEHNPPGLTHTLEYSDVPVKLQKIIADPVGATKRYRP
jgi:hypothetical protein